MIRKRLEESKAQVEALKKILKDKEGEISEAKGQLCQAKEDAVREYCDSDAFLKELGGSFADSFDDCFHQVKASFPDLDLSHISIDAHAQTPVHWVYSKGTNELFADDSPYDPQGVGETAHKDQGKSVEDEARLVEGNHVAKEKDGENSTDLQ